MPDAPWFEEGVPPVALTPCPEGWREVTGNAVSECDPYSVAGVSACGPGEAHFPGEPECRPIGDECPAGDYATTLPTEGRVIHVKADAAPGGDGSLAAPYDGLAAVNWNSLSPGTTVALAKGTYGGTLPLRPGVQVVGACVAETVVTGIDGPVLAVVQVTGTGETAVLRNITIRNSTQVGTSTADGRSLVLAGVLIEGAHEIGVLSVGAGTNVSLTDTVVRHTGPNMATGGFGFGIAVEDGAHLEATRLVVSDNRATGVFGAGVDSAIRLTDAVIRDTAPRASDRADGNGVLVQRGATLDATRILVERNHSGGIMALGTGSAAKLTDVVVRANVSQASNGRLGRGIGVQFGATLEATRLLVANNDELGIFGTHEGTSLSLSDVVIRDIQPRVADGAGGIGIVVQGDARLDGSRVLIDGAGDMGLMANLGSHVELRDAMITRIGDAACGRETPTGANCGYGAVVISASLRFTGFKIHQVATCGVFLSPLTGTTGMTFVDFESGVVSGTTIGACVQVEGYDLDRLTHEVAYRENGTNLSSTMLPVPGSVDSVGL